MSYWEYNGERSVREQKVYDLALSYVLAHYDARKMTEEEFFFALTDAYKKFDELTGAFPRPF